MLKNPRWPIALLIAMAFSAPGCDKKSPIEPSPPPACTYTLSTSSLSVAAAGVSAAVNVNTASNCTWSAASDRGWMTITSGSSGSGNGVVNVDLTPNPNETVRTGTLTIAGLSVAVSQDGVPGCSITISPDRASFLKDSVHGSFAVSAPAHCQWSAVSQAAWITVRSGSPGSGNGTVGFSIEENTESTPRTGTIAVGGSTFTVTQAGATVPLCTYTVSPVALVFGSGGGSDSVTVTTGANCSWTATDDTDWITIASGASGTGNGTVQVSVAPNSSDTRTGTLTVAGQAISVRQDALAPCSVDISPASASYSKDGGTGNFAVTAPAQCQWTAASSASWVTITSGSQGTGNGTVAYSVAANGAALPRSATISVANRTFTISQAGDTGSCDYLVQPVDVSACMTSPERSVTVTTQAGCTWTATASDSWITLPGGQSGVGSGVITFRLSDNYTDPRQGLVMVRWPTPTAGQNVRISQAGCHYAVSTSAIDVPVAGGPGKFDVIQASDPNSCGGPLQDACPWTATSDVPWITITTSMPQRGDNPVSFTVAPNGTGAARTGRITVRDKVVVVTQAGS